MLHASNRNPEIAKYIVQYIVIAGLLNFAQQLAMEACLLARAGAVSSAR
jgi:hypothetical protein